MRYVGYDPRYDATLLVSTKGEAYVVFGKGWPINSITGKPMDTDTYSHDYEPYLNLERIKNCVFL